jgi:hypothetical protein
MRGRFLTREPDFDYECSGLWNDLVVVIAFPSHETPEDERIRNALIGALEKAQISEFICAEQIAPHRVSIRYSCKDAVFRRLRIDRGTNDEQISVIGWMYMTCVRVNMVGRDACAELFDEEEAFDVAISCLKDNLPRRKFTFTNSVRMGNKEVVFEFEKG